VALVRDGDAQGKAKAAGALRQLAKGDAAIKAMVKVAQNRRCIGFMARQGWETRRADEDKL
jgi:hypothetical protein